MLYHMVDLVLVSRLPCIAAGELPATPSGGGGELEAHIG